MMINEFRMNINNTEITGWHFIALLHCHDPAGWVIIILYYCKQLSSSSYLSFIFLSSLENILLYARRRRSFNIWEGWCWLYRAWYNYSWFEELTIAFILLQLSGASSFVSVLGPWQYSVQIIRTPTLAVYILGLGWVSVHVHTYHIWLLCSQLVCLNKWATVRDTFLLICIEISQD